MAASYTWSYFGFRLVAFLDIYGFFQIDYALGLVQELLLDVGFFLILRAVLRHLPVFDRWARAGPPLILLGAVVLAVVDAIEILYAPVLYDPIAGAAYPWLYYVVPAFSVLGSVAVSLGLILSIVAVGRGVLALPGHPLAPAGP